MKTYTCSCGQRLFFDNHQCLKCDAELGHCPVCQELTSLIPTGDGTYRCGNPACGARLQKCANYAEYKVCNRCVALSEGEAPWRAFCDCCRYNQTIPDLSVPGNCEKWDRLEAAKRRLFYDLDLLGLPHGTAADGFDPPLSFDFKADIIPVADFWRSMGEQERVYTGHAQGRITINIREADELERERLRVDLGEAHRTLIGHFRHEIGHYYWDVLIRGQRDESFSQVFGNPYEPNYQEALESYYTTGAPADWSTRFVSAYAAMHPWEDWAETFALLLDMVSGLDTAMHLGFLPAEQCRLTDMHAMISAYQGLGIGLNELSRTMGLLDMVPEVIVPAVVDKLRYIHDAIRALPQHR